MVPPNLAASTPPRLSRRPTAQGGLDEGVDDRHGRRPPSPSQCRRPSRLCRRKHASLRAGPPPSGRGAGHESAPTLDGRLVATRAGGAGCVGSISGWGKRTATPMSARRAAKSDRVIGRRQRLSRRRRNRNAAVLENRPSPRMPRSANTRPSFFRGVTRRGARARANVPTTRGLTGRVRRRPARASPLLLLNGANRGGSVAPSTHRCEPYHPLRGGALITSQRPPKRDGSLPRVPAVPDPSARSRVGGRRRRRRCPPVAPPNPIASTTPLICRCQRLRRRRRNRNAAVSEGRPSPGMPRAINARPSLSGASPVAVPVRAP